MTTAPARPAQAAESTEWPDNNPLPPAAFEHELRELARRRYHDTHPFNVRMHQGGLSPAELRTWVANRFHYQRSIPVKDALILAKLPEPAMRRSWLRRIQDHDGLADGEGGIERWLRLGEAVGLDRTELESGGSVLPGVRFAVDGYVNFCRLSPVLEAVASSLTELCAPNIMLTRLEAFPRHYPWIEEPGLAYFRSRVPQGRRDGVEALNWVTEWARTRSEQLAALSALSFKCDILWSLLDAVEHGSRPGSAA
ncbi:pyrroloquinoline-quinone synthase PqqC [Streptomyces sp. A0642]|uniref:pyrroloquinoline-quinone synthase PqqC n=1 Tax=Streptomyces sp. A0642 TaxID=2563100 RepID=UPI0010A28D29|nr:pyrroloquinoline-quinone synthase PqqC [Streptomyces sp. A0642]THA69378.1 pyrroloquinoline-quinone synthase PqqC [Streptomyces sp. A0642]